MHLLILVLLSSRNKDCYPKFYIGVSVEANFQPCGLSWLARFVGNLGFEAQKLGIGKVM